MAPRRKTVMEELAAAVPHSERARVQMETELQHVPLALLQAEIEKRGAANGGATTTNALQSARAEEESAALRKQVDELKREVHRLRQSSGVVVRDPDLSRSANARLEGGAILKLPPEVQPAVASRTPAVQPPPPPPQMLTQTMRSAPNNALGPNSMADAHALHATAKAEPEPEPEAAKASRLQVEPEMAKAVGCIQIVLSLDDEGEFWHSGAVVEDSESGCRKLRLDNSNVTKNAKFKGLDALDVGTPFSALLDDGDEVSMRIGPSFKHEVMERLLVLHDGKLCDATVDLRLQHNRHRLQIDGSLVDVDLNPFNHCRQLSDDATQYESCRASYCAGLAEELMIVEDAITGNRLNVREQLICITMDTGEDGRRSIATNVRRDRVNLAFRNVTDMRQMAKLLVSSSPHRSQGVHEEQSILIRRVRKAF
eukprot:581763-Prymnesium_polylepis.1